jgi:uncharacterized protein YqhQ
MPKTKFKVHGGSCFKNGVGYTYKNSFFGVKAIRQEDGSIAIEDFKMSFGNSQELKNSWSTLNKKQKGIIIGILLIILFWRRIVVLIHLPMFFYHLPVLTWILILIAIARHYLKEPLVTQYHGAEHKVANWAKKHENLDDIKGMQKCSRVHLGCGTNLLCTPLFMYLTGSLCMAFFHFHIWDILIILAVLFLSGFLPFNIFGLVMQKLFTTSEPTDDQVEVAAAALKELIRREKLKEAEKAESNSTTSDNCQEI